MIAYKFKLLPYINHPARHDHCQKLNTLYLDGLYVVAWISIDKYCDPIHVIA